ncbi:sugar epimerase [Thermaurantimonas aggregans]|uniref:Sugar epimerase n=1 Tax=Thermaurantimonas aggregans TaxID=2173829 RepID=A0A401XJZ2_9FLAO|nr:WxcM-like domain-containing protein [Thermaurantimonas aggregans]MCX8148609.1 WxcM-like domain-containing protein [Thermaurantimonas aggregans]GCD77322.1 sugar epimerase [Thermaurantimonas aggregans]
MIISGDIYKDHRGTIRFINEFNMSSVVRMYCIKPNFDVIRAWQGHKLENKWFFVSKGSFLIKTIQMDSSKKNEYLLSEKKSEVLHIMPGNYNGFKALEKGSILIVFSDLTIEQSKSDDYRISIEQLPW